MTTKLRTPIRREIEIDGKPYTIIISNDLVKIAPKGHQIGTVRTWRQFLALMPPVL